MLGASQRRARPMDLGGPSSADRPLPDPLAETTWIEPVPDARVVPAGGDPADVAASRADRAPALPGGPPPPPPQQRAGPLPRDALPRRGPVGAPLRRGRAPAGPTPP